VARTRTLSGMRDDLRWLADIQSLTLRHADSELNRAINQSCQRFRELVSSAAINQYLVSTTKTVSAGATSPYPFRVIDLSAENPSVSRVYSVDLIVSGVMTPLVAESFSARADYSQSLGIPAAFASMSTYEVVLMPAPQAAYVAVIWFLPTMVDLVDDADEFDGVAGYEEWINWDVLVKVIQRDTYPQLYATATAERDRLERDMVKALGAVNQRSVGVRRDSVGARSWSQGRRLHHGGGGVAGGPGIFDATFDWSHS
jgi:hypothetical protein